jgi:hypothetical protein
MGGGGHQGHDCSDRRLLCTALPFVIRPMGTRASAAWWHLCSWARGAQLQATRLKASAVSSPLDRWHLNAAVGSCTANKSSGRCARRDCPIVGVNDGFKPSRRPDAPGGHGTRFRGCRTRILPAPGSQQRAAAAHPARPFRGCIVGRPRHAACLAAARAVPASPRRSEQQPLPTGRCAGSSGCYSTAFLIIIIAATPAAQGCNVLLASLLLTAGNISRSPALRRFSTAPPLR